MIFVFYKTIAKTFYLVMLVEVLFHYFYFPPDTHLFLDHLVIVNFIFLCKLHIINIEKKIQATTECGFTLKRYDKNMIRT